MDLPDVNVLIALFDPKHSHHNAAQTWFVTASHEGWATCPLTENEFLRVVSNPNYANLQLSVAALAQGLRTLIDAWSSSYMFWHDDISLCDTTLYDLRRIQGHRQLTDLYLLGLCQQHEDATLVTFDGGISSAIDTLIVPRAGLIRLLTL